MARRFAILIAAAAFAAAPLRADWSALEKRVVEHRLSNGIRLLILERHYSPTVSVRMIFPTGSVDEASGKTGLAHMFEHMLFKGTRTIGTRDYIREMPLLAQIDALYRDIDLEKYGQPQPNAARVDSLLERVRALEKQAAALATENELWNIYEREGGSNLNASTSRDCTDYRVDLPANKLALWAMLDSDRVRFPVFRQFYQEREVVKEERRMRVDNDPDGKLFEQFLAAAYLSHPYRNPTIGWESDLDRLHVADLQDFYTRFYTPDRLIMTVVGDVKASEVIALAEKWFSPWKAGPARPYPITQEVPQTGMRQLVVKADAQRKLLVGFPLPAYPGRDHFVAEALVNLLTEGTASRLYKSVVEKRALASSISSFKDYPGNRYPPLFIIAATPLSPTTNERLLAAIQEEIDRLQKKPIEDWEVEKVKASTEMFLLNLLQSNGGMADVLAYSEAVFGDWRYLLEYAKQMQTVKPKEIQTLAAKVLRVDQRTTAFLEPER